MAIIRPFRAWRYNEETIRDINLKFSPLFDVVSKEQLEGTAVDDKTGVIRKNGKDIGVMVNGMAYAGFPTPSRKNEFFSQTMVDWGWPEYETPVYIKSNIHPEKLEQNYYILNFAQQFFIESIHFVHSFVCFVQSLEKYTSQLVFLYFMRKS